MAKDWKRDENRKDIRRTSGQGHGQRNIQCTIMTLNAKSLVEKADSPSMNDKRVLEAIV